MSVSVTDGQLAGKRRGQLDTRVLAKLGASAAKELNRHYETKKMLRGPNTPVKCLVSSRCECSTAVQRARIGAHILRRDSHSIAS